jgi:hypothetical protein
LVCGGFLVVGGQQQSRAAVPPADVVELQAPGDQDLARLGSGGEAVPGQHLAFEGGKERLRGSVVEALTG